MKSSANSNYSAPRVKGPPERNPDINLSSDLSAASGVTHTRGSSATPYVALTFDDGPHPSLTPRLLDILRDRNVKATFYVVGTNVDAYPQIVRRIVAEGHEIGNHSWKHNNFTKMSADQCRDSLNKCRDSIVKACGVQPRTFRPPYGALRQDQRQWIFNEYGYPTILWSVDPLDWKYRNAYRVENELVNKAHNGAILLAHDIHKTTVDAVPGTIDRLIRKGHTFVTVSQLLAQPSGVAQAAVTP
ncbi:polysaccharide deacetylase family protein [Persicirhabdus sediminis]|uniref:polysaccharide deacetylase family protein n=1 Tax=Persicirhabdus sediminis TaxID=454144 RepID=UPI002D8087AE|nr:polysaccharide deacetylase family protein [Persicirhabdus sediminis]